MKILVIEDDLDLNESLRELLLEEGYQVESETSGNLAIRRLKDELFDLIVSDFLMPNGSGRDVLVYLRSRSDIHPKFIMITGQAGESREDILGLGADECLIKPFNLEYFVNTIRRLVAGRC